MVRAATKIICKLACIYFITLYKHGHTFNAAYQQEHDSIALKEMINAVSKVKPCNVTKLHKPRYINHVSYTLHCYCTHHRMF